MQNRSAKEEVLRVAKECLLSLSKRIEDGLFDMKYDSKRDEIKELYFFTIQPLIKRVLQIDNVDLTEAMQLAQSVAQIFKTTASNPKFQNITYQPIINAWEEAHSKLQKLLNIKLEVPNASTPFGKLFYASAAQTPSTFPSQAGVGSVRAVTAAPGPGEVYRRRVPTENLPVGAGAGIATGARPRAGAGFAADVQQPLTLSTQTVEPETSNSLLKKIFEYWKNSLKYDFSKFEEKIKRPHAEVKEIKNINGSNAASIDDVYQSLCKLIDSRIEICDEVKRSNKLFNIKKFMEEFYEELKPFIIYFRNLAQTNLEEFEKERLRGIVDSSLAEVQIKILREFSLEPPLNYPEILKSTFPTAQKHAQEAINPSAAQASAPAVHMAVPFVNNNAGAGVVAEVPRSPIKKSWDQISEEYSSLRKLIKKCSNRERGLAVNDLTKSIEGVPNRDGLKVLHVLATTSNYYDFDSYSLIMFCFKNGITPQVKDDKGRTVKQFLEELGFPEKWKEFEKLWVEYNNMPKESPTETPSESKIPKGPMLFGNQPTGVGAGTGTCLETKGVESLGNKKTDQLFTKSLIEELGKIKKILNGLSYDRAGNLRVNTSENRRVIDTLNEKYKQLINDIKNKIEKEFPGAKVSFFLEAELDSLKKVLNGLSSDVIDDNTLKQMQLDYPNFISVIKNKREQSAKKVGKFLNWIKDKKLRAVQPVDEATQLLDQTV